MFLLKRVVDGVFLADTRPSHHQHPAIFDLHRRCSLLATTTCLPQDENTSYHRKRSVVAILEFFLSQFDRLHRTWPVPYYTPALGKTLFFLGAGATSIFGSLTNVCPAGMLFGLFLWPIRLDGKPIMTLSFLGSRIGLVLQAAVMMVRSNAPLYIAYFLATTRALTGAFLLEVLQSPRPTWQDVGY